MSDLSDRKSASTMSLGATELGAQAQSKVKPVQVWAAVGGAAPGAFRSTSGSAGSAGPTSSGCPPGRPNCPPVHEGGAHRERRRSLDTSCRSVFGGSSIRPWRRERRITLDGMLMVSMGLMMFQDPLLNYFNTWCTYNTWLWNRGAWSSNIPGWVSPEAPGRQVRRTAVDRTLPGYACGVLLITIVGCWVHAQDQGALAEHQQPSADRSSPTRSPFVFDFVMEGLHPAADRASTPIPARSDPCRSMPAPTTSGPIYEGLMWGGVQAASVLPALLHRRSRPHRRRARTGPASEAEFAKQQFIRFLAIFAAVSACFFFFYNVPAQWIGMHADPWPAGPPEAVLLQRRHLRRRDRQALSRSRAADTHQALRLHQHRRPSSCCPTASELPTIVPFERGN